MSDKQKTAYTLPRGRVFFGLLSDKMSVFEKPPHRRQRVSIDAVFINTPKNGQLAEPEGEKEKKEKQFALSYRDRLRKLADLRLGLVRNRARVNALRTTDDAARICRSR